jgi:hypothetical protein
LRELNFPNQPISSPPPEHNQFRWFVCPGFPLDGDGVPAGQSPGAATHQHIADRQSCRMHESGPSWIENHHLTFQYQGKSGANFMVMD